MRICGCVAALAFAAVVRGQAGEGPVRSENEPEPVPTTAPVQTSTPEEFRPFGVKLTVPIEWKRLPETRGSVIGRWGVLKAGTTDKISVLCTVELEPSRGRAAEAFAKDVATHLKGQVESTAAELGGQRACRVIADMSKDPSKPKPMEALITQHDGYLYCAAAVQDQPGVDQSQALGELRRGLEFCEIEPPSAYVALSQAPLTFFKKFRIRLLSTLRPGEQPARDAVQLRAFNLRRDRPDLVVALKVLTVKPGVTVEQVGNELVNQTDAAREKPVEWVTLENAPVKMISKPFTATANRTFGRQLTLRLGLVQLSDHEMALIDCSLTTSDSSDRILYEQICEDMVRSVEVVKK